MIRKNVLALCFAFLSLGILSSGAEIQVIEADGAIQTGNWIRYEVKITPIIEKEVTPTWVKLAFTSIVGTNMTVQTTIHLSDGDEWSQTSNIDIASGSNTGLIIPSNSKIGDSIYIGGYGNISIKGETTATYTGINRTTIFTSYSNSTDDSTFFWDKQTGIMLEQSTTKNEITTFWKIIDTNIWNTQPNDYPPYQNIFYIAIILGGILVSVIFLMKRKKRPRRRTHKRTARII